MITVDRFEGNIAVLIYDDGTRREVPLSKLPEGVREGSVITETQSGFVLDEAATASRRKSNAQRMRNLFKKR